MSPLCADCCSNYMLFSEQCSKVIHCFVFAIWYQMHLYCAHVRAAGARSEGAARAFLSVTQMRRLGGGYRCWLLQHSVASGCGVNLELVFGCPRRLYDAHGCNLLQFVIKFLYHDNNRCGLVSSLGIRQCSFSCIILV